jgi:aspartate-semialdehyde dehydrogenase
MLLSLTKDKIIANPNCSTIQMVLVLALCIKKNTISSVIVSTYQSITGTGVKKQQLENEYAGVQVKWHTNTQFIGNSTM